MSRTKIVGLSLLLVIAIGLSFGAGYAFGTRSQPSLPQGLDVVVQAWDIIFEDYVDRDRLDSSTLSQGAIRGMIEALDDPHSAYIDAETRELFTTSIEGKFEGIGATMSNIDGQLVVITPLPDSPAAKAGIRSGDSVLEVDGQPTAGMSLEEAVIRIRGPKGTPVSLLVLHEGEAEPELIEIIRAEIEVPSVYFEMMDTIAYIYINPFSERTPDELAPVIHDINQGAATGIILDLRSNGGGIVQAAVDVASHFLHEGVVAYVVYHDGEQTAYSVRSTLEKTDLPMVVLVDNFSASATEILVGALQDYGRATIAGSKTLGKGSANLLRELKDGSGIYITTARWLTPNGRLIEGEGLHPDYELELDNGDAVQWAIDYLKGNE